MRPDEKVRVRIRGEGARGQQIEILEQVGWRNLWVQCLLRARPLYVICVVLRACACVRALCVSCVVRAVYAACVRVRLLCAICVLECVCARLLCVMWGVRVRDVCCAACAVRDAFACVRVFLDA